MRSSSGTSTRSGQHPLQIFACLLPIATQHLAMGQKEEYEEWLYMYRKDRDVKMNERRVKMEADWTLWRNKFGRLGCIDR